MVKKKRSSEKKTARRGKAAARRKPVAKKSTVRSIKKTAARRKPVAKPAAIRKAVKKAAGKTVKKKPAVQRRPSARATRGRAESSVVEDFDARGLGPDSAGQSGDTEGLSRAELADSESVEELLEEGQAFEAGIVSGVENAPPAGRRGVRTRQVPEDDVPQEYLDED
jgi:hypothetical protein